MKQKMCLLYFSGERFGTKTDKNLRGIHAGVKLVKTTHAS
jgi:hypothetical protein